MIAEPDEHFIGLALLVATDRATDAERAELSSLVAARPALQAEFERVKADARLASELLPLLVAAEAKPGKLPAYARERLRAKVRRTIWLETPKSWRSALSRWLRPFVAPVPVALALMLLMPLSVMRLSSPPKQELPRIAPSPPTKELPRIAQTPTIHLALVDSSGAGDSVGATPLANAAISSLTTGAFLGFPGKELSWKLKAAPPATEVLERVWTQSRTLVFSDPSLAERWRDAWPLDDRIPNVKILYDADKHQLIVAGRWKGNPPFAKFFQVKTESDLPAVLEKAQTFIAEQTR